MCCSSSETPSTPVALSGTPEEWYACAGAFWIPRYRQHTFRTIVIDLPPDFVEFLVEDEPSTVIRQEGEYGDWSDEDAAGPEGAEALDSTWSQRFPHLHAAIEAAITQLGGRVAPKLSWSSPTDATWVSHNHSLLCANAEQVILLLKSSDRAAHDVSFTQRLAAHASALPSSHTSVAAPPLALVLRRWRDLRPEREFRCFVYDHELHAISQRDPSQHFPQLRGEVGVLRAAICAFFRHHVGSSFPVPNYAMDVYISSSGNVTILDFNPIVDTTSPLLFTWEELPYEWPRPVDADSGALSGASGGDEGYGEDRGAAGRRSQGSAAASQQPGRHPQEPRDVETAAQAPLMGRRADALVITNGSSRAEGHHQGGSSSGALYADVSALEGSEGSSAADDDLVDMRIVEQPGMVQPGARVACGMPFDMLHLDGAVSDIVALMQQQERPQR